MNRIRNLCITLPLLMAEAGHGTVPAETPIMFQADSGESVAAYEGRLRVPENRAAGSTRQITLRYVRFPSVGKGSTTPIVYLAGGPGGSGIGTAKRQRFPLFMAMREFGDVIAFDQRGTGASDDLPRCDSSFMEPYTEALSDAEYAALYRASVLECRRFWENQGIDLMGYTTPESVQDLDALRQHLGADRLTLWGTSYGSHLALHAVKTMGGRIERMVLSSAEGLDQTVKLPARTDDFFRRLQAAIDTQPAARAAYPDVRALIRRVHARLETDPVSLEIPLADNGHGEFLATRSAMQRFASWLVGDPRNTVNLLGIYAALDQGNHAPLVSLVQRIYRPSAPVSWNGMSLAMDAASGIGVTRLATFERQAESALLGAYLNFPMPQVREAMLDFDLGDGFRTPPESDVPTLLLSGTLDGRTYIESQREAVAGFRNLQAVTVVNAGHNLFMSSPAVTGVIQSFMRGEQLSSRTVFVALPDFLPPDQR